MPESRYLRIHTKEKRVGSLRALAAMLALSVIAVAPARANSVTFAQYFEQTGNQEWSLTTSPSSATLTASGNEFFIFNNTLTPFNGMVLSAAFLLTMTTATAGNCGNVCANGDSLTEQGYSGTFSFIGNSPTDGVLNGVNLLSGTFSTGGPNLGGTFLCTVGSGCGSLSAGTSPTQPGQVTFTSGVAGINFATQTALAAAFSFSSTNPASFAVGTVTSGTAFPAGGPYNLAGTGTFSTQPGFVPEPGSLTLTSVGFGLCALASVLRRSRSKVPLGVR